MQLAGPMRLQPVLVSFLMAVLGACGGGGGSDDGDPDAMPDATPMPTGAIAGKVIAEHAGGTDVVPGAVISIEGGPSTTADGHGDFVLDDVPAGDPVRVTVLGPRAGDPAYPFVFGTYRELVTVTEGEPVAIAPVLIPGCERGFDAAAGATVALAGCGGSGRAELVFPPDALVGAGGAPFTGDVRAEIAVLDPAAGAQAMAVPRLADELTDAELFGAIEVRLADALTGEPLQVAAGAAVEVSIEVTDAIAAAPAYALRWFDPDAHAWVEQPAGAIESQGGRTFYRFSAAHFSQYAVAYLGGPIPNQSCIDVTYANGQAPNVQLRSGTRWAIRRAPSGGCVQAWPQSGVAVRAIGHLGINSPARILTPWETATTGPAVPDSCDGSTSCDPVTLSFGPEGCLRGTYQSLARSCTPGAVVPGWIWFRRDGLTFHSIAASNLCDQPFGGPAIGSPGAVVVPPGNGPVVIGDVTGSFLTWSPSWSGGLGCEDLQTVAATGFGLHPRMVARVVQNAAAHADPGSAYTLELDASASEGTIHTYRWELYEVEGASETLVWTSSSAAATTQVWVDAGSYRVNLSVYAGVSLVATTTKLRDVPGPTASFTTSPSTPGIGQTIQLDASASTGTIVEYAWDFDGGDFDATGVTASHAYDAEGARQIRLRVTDDAGAIDEAVASFTVQDALPPFTLRLTILGPGRVVSTDGSWTCQGPGTCQATFPAGYLVLSAYFDDGTPHNWAWGSLPNADGYQAAFDFTEGQSYDVTASFLPS